MKVTRLAPSPTGPLHIGHLFHIIHLLKFAKSNNAKIILRIEDHDSARSRREHTLDILKQLRNWGIFSYICNISNQRTRLQRYQNILRLLKNQVFHCQCSRKDLMMRVGKNEYDGHCRNKSFKSGHVRLNLSYSKADPILINSEGDFSYFFCNVVDDIDQSVTHVIRGADIEHYTEMQKYFFSILGYHPPEYIHHELIIDSTGKKVSKRKQDKLALEKVDHESLKFLADKLGIKGEFDYKSLGDILDLTS